MELDLQGGSYTSVGSVMLPAALAPGTWHTVTTTVSGTTITVSLDSQPVATVNSASFPAGTTAYPAGTIGFREYSGEEADFRNLTVTSSSGSTLYTSPLNAASDLSDFAVPGVNSLPSILDGAKRDRAIWAGDMNVEGPSVYYSTGQAQYIKGALQLLGSYQLSSGFVTGDLPPQDALHAGANQNGTTGSYSASHSIYWVLGAANPGPAGAPAGYTACAAENGTCSFTGTQSVAYGADGISAYQTLTGGTACGNAVSGDPDYGTVKACFLLPAG